MLIFGVVFTALIETMIYDNVDWVSQELFESLVFKYYVGLKKSKKSGDSISDCVNLLHYKRYIINLNCGGSYIDSTDWMKKNKKATINLINDNDKLF